MRTVASPLLVVLLLGGTLIPAGAHANEIACEAEFAVTESWDSGYTASLAITQAGSLALDGWQIEFDLPADHQIQTLWDGILEVSGSHAIVRNEPYNAALAPGQSVRVGFVAQHAGDAADPSDFRLEGVGCDTPDPVDPADPDPPPPGFDEAAFLQSESYWTYGMPYFSYLVRLAQQAGTWSGSLLDEVAALENHFGQSRPGSPFAASEPTLPAPPSALTAEVQGVDRVWLRWQDESEDEDGFQLERQQDAGAWAAVATTDANLTSTVDSSLSGPVLYRYRVAAYNAAGLSASSPEVEVGIGLRDAGAGFYTSLACDACHGALGQGGPTGVPVTRLSDPILLAQKIETDMPLGNPGACDATCAAALAEFILASFVTPTADCAEVPLPSRQLRLLTRREYENTITDLLGLETGVTANFPVEVRVGGYDNNAGAALVTSRHVDEYVAAAQELAARALSEQREALLPCDPTTDASACAEAFVRELGRLTYRRPLDEAETTRLLDLFGSEPGADFNAGVEAVVTALLVSPHFLYRSETGTPVDAFRARLEPWEIASELSYLYWGSTPDAALLDAAESGGLDSEAQRVAQAERLLADPRARRQLGTFVAQWLDADPMMAGNKDVSAFPSFDDAVREAQFRELEAFANHVFFDSTGRFDELFEADYAMVDQTLDNFYGLGGSAGAQFERTPVTDGHRGGLLRLGSVLASHAHADDSSPVRRGVFVRERLLCQELPPPPPDVDNTPPGLDPTLTTRERFAVHSSAPSCQSCHQFIDGVGFGFQAFDAVGQFRIEENELPVDTTGTVVGLEDQQAGSAVAFDGLGELSSILAASRAARACLPAQLERYASGRAEDASLSCEIQQLQQNFEANGGDLRELLLDVVRLPSFTHRRLD